MAAKLTRIEQLRRAIADAHRSAEAAATAAWRARGLEATGRRCCRGRDARDTGRRAMPVPPDVLALVGEAIDRGDFSALVRNPDEKRWELELFNGRFRDGKRRVTVLLAGRLGLALRAARTEPVTPLAPLPSPAGIDPEGLAVVSLRVDGRQVAQLEHRDTTAANAMRSSLADAIAALAKEELRQEQAQARVS